MRGEARLPIRTLAAFDNRHNCDYMRCDICYGVKTPYYGNRRQIGSTCKSLTNCQSSISILDADVVLFAAAPLAYPRSSRLSHRSPAMDDRVRRQTVRLACPFSHESWLGWAVRVGETSDEPIARRAPAIKQLRRPRPIECRRAGRRREAQNGRLLLSQPQAHCVLKGTLFL